MTKIIEIFKMYFSPTCIKLIIDRYIDRYNCANVSLKAH